jgi:lipoprotein-anchoring transpeptidase ErfK/SrfK
MTAQSHLLRSCLGFIALAVALSSCSSAPQEEEAQVPAKSSSNKFWIGDQVTGKPKLVIDLTAQRIRYYKGDKLVGVSPISSGRESHSTVTGTFRISQKDRYHRSSLYGDYVDSAGNVVMEDVDVRKDTRPEGSRFLGAKMHYFMRVVGAIGMHEGYLPGYPASHGCIRLPTDMAAIFYNATPHGTPVQIIGNGALAEYEPPATVPYATQQRSTKPARKSATPKRDAYPRGTTLYL